MAALFRPRSSLLLLLGVLDVAQCLHYHQENKQVQDLPGDWVPLAHGSNELVTNMWTLTDADEALSLVSEARSPAEEKLPAAEKDAGNTSGIPLGRPGDLGGPRVKDDIRMVVAIIGAPAILYLLRTDMLRRGSMLVILVVSLLYVCASLFMNVLNKKAARAFEATCLLVILQMIVSVVVILCMEFDKMKLEKWKDFVKWLIVPFAFAGMLGTSMYAFKEASLTTILIMRNILPILTFGFEKILFNQPETAGLKLIGSLLFTLAGSVLYGCVDISATNWGKVLILVNCLFTIVDRLVQAHLLKGHKDFSISLPLCMLLNNSLGIIPVLILAAVKGEIGGWGAAIRHADKTTWFLVLMSGLCGASLGYVGLRVQQLVSGTTVLVLQNFNKVLIISIGMGLFHDRLTPLSLVGCGVSLLGCFAYGYLRLPSEAKAKDEPVKAAGKVGEGAKA